MSTDFEIKPDVIYHNELEGQYAETHVDDLANVKGQYVVDNDAQGYVDPTLHVSEAESKRLRRRIDRRILPLLCLAYLCQALDKGTLGTASIMGWQADVGAVGQDYSLTGTLLWCGIVLGEPFANQAVRRFPLGKLLSGGIFIWSALLLGLTFSLSIPPVFAIRFLLGFFESLVGPCLLAITVQWYLREEQAFVSSIWQCMLGVSSAISALLGFGFYHVENKHAGLYGWQWMSLAIALFSFISSIILFFLMPDSPTRTRWANEHDKTLFVERVRSNNQGLKHKEFKSAQAIEAAKDPYTYLLFFLALFNTLVVGGINTFSSLLINKAFGFDVLQSQLLSIPLGTMTVLMYMLMAYLITKTRQTLYCMIGFCIPNIAGTITLLCVAPSDKSKGGLIVAFYIMQCFQACNPAIFLMLSRNSAGQTKKSITYAVTYVGWAGGNAVAPQIFQSVWAPRYIHSLEIHIALYGCFIITCLITRLLLVRRNKQKTLAQSHDNSETLGSGVTPYANLHAFEDLTDLENPDFRYSL
ncbi:major facilitator superfamily domain-containing protein [Naematelia encephala]|uniref:Major facilitator superfamily domain-containing protein n=1 Tax=Naematelia encephala TaxID=71784 RepID=A0A1Y2B974_9TREE|nr:major facilitator superfamily domain-containing protein [Naematelia encephala]